MKYKAHLNGLVIGLFSLFVSLPSMAIEPTASLKQESRDQNNWISVPDKQDNAERLPGGGDVRAMVLDTENTTLYVGVSGQSGEGGVYRINTLDSNSAWQMVGTALEHHRIISLLLVEKTLYAGVYLDGVYAINLDEANADWQPVGINSPGEWIQSMVLHSGFLYAGNAMTHLDGGGVMRRVTRIALASLDASPDTAEWEDIGLENPGVIPGKHPVWTLAVDPVEQYLYAGLNTGYCTLEGDTSISDGVYQLDLKGDDPTKNLWEQVGGGVPANGNMAALLLDKPNADSNAVLYAGVNNRPEGLINKGAHILDDSGIWAAFGQVPLRQDVQSFAISETSLYAGTGFNACPNTGNGVYSIAKSGEAEWMALGELPIRAARSVASVIFDSTTNTLYAGTYYDGVYRIQQ